MIYSIYKKEISSQMTASPDMKADDGGLPHSMKARRHSGAISGVYPAISKANTIDENTNEAFLLNYAEENGEIIDYFIMASQVFLNNKFQFMADLTKLNNESITINAYYNYRTNNVNDELGKRLFKYMKDHISTPLKDTRLINLGYNKYSGESYIGSGTILTSGGTTETASEELGDGRYNQKICIKNRSGYILKDLIFMDSEGVELIILNEALGEKLIIENNKDIVINLTVDINFEGWLIK